MGFWACKGSAPTCGAYLAVTPDDRVECPQCEATIDPDHIRSAVGCSLIPDHAGPHMYVLTVSAAKNVHISWEDPS